MLNFAKLEAGHVEFELADVSVHDILEEVEPLMLRSCGAQAAATSLRSLRAGAAVRADPEKVRQILLNLLSNA